MSKIVIAVNQMINNADKITEVVKAGNSYFFKYDKKYYWSLASDYDYFDNEKPPEYLLTYYNKYVDIDKEIEKRGGQRLGLRRRLIIEDGDPEIVEYSTKVLKANEAYESFQELYQILKEKNSGLEDVLDEIIGNE